MSWRQECSPFSYCETIEFGLFLTILGCFIYLLQLCSYCIQHILVVFNDIYIYIFLSCSIAISFVIWLYIFINLDLNLNFYSFSLLILPSKFFLSTSNEPFLLALVAENFLRTCVASRSAFLHAKCNAVWPLRSMASMFAPFCNK